MFAKLYEPSPGQQILVMLRETARGRGVIRYYYEIKGLGTVTSIQVFKGVKSLQNARNAFDAITEASACKAVSEARKFWKTSTPSLFNDEEEVRE